MVATARDGEAVRAERADCSIRQQINLAMGKVQNYRGAWRQIVVRNSRSRIWKQYLSDFFDGKVPRVVP